MAPRFKKNIQNLIENLFMPDRLRKKRIFDHYPNGKEYFEYLSAYAVAFESEEVPEPISIYKITVDKQIATLIDHSMTYYKNESEAFAQTIPNSDPDLSNKLLENHLKVKNASIEIFKNKDKMGSEETIQNYTIQLEDKLDIYYLKWSARILNITDVLQNLEKEANETLEKLNEDTNRKVTAMKDLHQAQADYLNDKLLTLNLTFAQEMKMRKDLEEEQKKEIANLEALAKQQAEDNAARLNAAELLFKEQLQNATEQKAIEDAQRKADYLEKERKQNETLTETLKNIEKSSLVYNMTVEHHQRTMAEERSRRLKDEEKSRQELIDLEEQYKREEEDLKNSQERQQKRFNESLTLMNEQYEKEVEDRKAKEAARKEEQRELEMKVKELEDKQKKEVIKILEDKARGVQSLKLELKDQYGPEIKKLEAELQQKKKEAEEQAAKPKIFTFFENIFTKAVSKVIPI